MIGLHVRPGLEADSRPFCSNHGGDDRGNTIVEAAIIAPVFIVLFLGALLAADRYRHASAAVTQAAADAARQASIARTATQARTTATTSALTTLRHNRLRCSPQLELDLSAFSRPAGQAAMVSARVTCIISLADLGVPSVPGSRTVTKIHYSPLDMHRAR